MKRVLISTFLCVLILSLMAACSSREAVPFSTVSASSEQEEANANSTISSEPLESPSSTEHESMPVQNSEQSAPVWSPKDQPDPTLPENQKGPQIKWENKEYLAFGDPTVYLPHQVIVLNEETNEKVRVTVSLPESLSFGEYQRIEYDGGFKNGTISIGALVGYYKLNGSETMLDNKLFNQRFSFSPKPEPIETATEVKFGAYTENDKFMRFVSESVSGNYMVDYIVKLKDGYVTILEFSVSQSVTINELALYDAIANSVTE